MGMNYKLYLQKVQEKIEEVERVKLQGNCLLGRWGGVGVCICSVACSIFAKWEEEGLTLLGFGVWKDGVTVAVSSRGEYTKSTKVHKK